MGPAHFHWAILLSSYPTEIYTSAYTVVNLYCLFVYLQDYIVFLPEDYYKAGLLKNIPPGPCMLRTSRPEICDMYTYYGLKSPSIVTVTGDLAYSHSRRGLADLFTDPRYSLDEPHLSSMALLDRNQVLCL